MLAFIYLLSNLLFPFLLFPWLAAGTLIPMPWLIVAVFEFESLGSTIIFFIWAAILSILSDIIYRLVPSRKYSLPILLASLPAFAFAIIAPALTTTTHLG